MITKVVQKRRTITISKKTNLQISIGTSDSDSPSRLWDWDLYSVQPPPPVIQFWLARLTVEKTVQNAGSPSPTSSSSFSYTPSSLFSSAASHPPSPSCAINSTPASLSSPPDGSVEQPPPLLGVSNYPQQLHLTSSTEMLCDGGLEGSKCNK